VMRGPRGGWIWPGVVVVGASALILLIGFEQWIVLDGNSAPLVAIAVGLMTGFLIGRFWVLWLPLLLLGGLMIVGILFPSECRPEEGCREELSTEAGLVILAFYLLCAEVLLGFGVIARRVLNLDWRDDR
jgi:hypothetical protein